MDEIHVYHSVVGGPKMRSGIHTWRITLCDSDSNAGVAFKALSAFREDDYDEIADMHAC